MNKYGKYMKGDSWYKLIPEMKTALNAMLEEAQLQGIEARFYSGYRTEAEEIEHIRNGKSRLTDPLNSEHLWGIAADIDLTIYKNLIPTTPEFDNPIWDKLHSIGEKYGLEFYISWDKPHCRLKGYNVNSLRARFNNPNQFLETMKG